MSYSSMLYGAAPPGHAAAAAGPRHGATLPRQAVGGRLAVDDRSSHHNYLLHGQINTFLLPLFLKSEGRPRLQKS
jgi:hypothetical protein